jgi:glycosyltransferase involved in cell wall biosynthesis
MRYVFILCNALDDLTRKQRGIYTDSPAASKKVIELCKSIQGRGSRCFIISLGRGKAEGPARFFPSSIQKIDSVTIIYAPFSTIPFFSELISFFAPLIIVFRFRLKVIKTIIFYNPMSAYLPTLIFSAALGFRRILDLEDGHVPVIKRKFFSSIRVFVERLFDYSCNGGALLACDALAKFTTLKPTLTYYGAVSTNLICNDSRFQNTHIRFLFAGTLERETGAELLIDAINAIRIERANWAHKAIFEITGKGSSLDRFNLLASQNEFPKVIVHGRTTNAEYQDILSNVDVGLSLKLPDGPYANTTFPSKVMEFAANKVLVLTTDISDVQKVLGKDGALYLQDGGLNLHELIRQAIENRAQMALIANEGHSRLIRMNSAYQARDRLTRFIFEGK